MSEIPSSNPDQIDGLVNHEDDSAIVDSPTSAGSTPITLEFAPVHPHPPLTFSYMDPAQNSSAPELVTENNKSPLPDRPLTRASTISAHKKTCSFATHISVQTTWPATIYDRRGEIATCNRLTPALAQSIKEECVAWI